MAAEGGVDGFGCDGVVIKDGGAEHDECTPCVVGGVVIYDVPGGEGCVEGVIVAVEVEACFLYVDDV